MCCRVGRHVETGRSASTSVMNGVHPGRPSRGARMPEVLLDGLALGESPRWHDDRLWFSDWGARQVIAVDVEGNSEVVAEVPSFPFCIDFRAGRSPRESSP